MKNCKDWQNAECGKQNCCHYCEIKASCKTPCQFDANYCANLIDTDECTSLEALKKQSSDIIKTITDITLEKQRLEKIEEQMKAKLKEAMETYGVKKFENDVISVTYVEPTTRTSVDSDKLKKDGLYEKYSKTSNVKSYIKIQVK